jgi:4-hydroxybenzoate polyprenyltransferase
LSGRDLVALFRPGQWTKNGIVFAGLIFSQHLRDPAYLLRAVAGFVVFCAASSAVYVLNDLMDVERDRLHPVKRNRPIAAGRISRGTAAVLGGTLVAAALVAASTLGPSFRFSLIVFLLVNAAYSISLRSIVILDVMLIAISFVIRAVAGVMVLRPLAAAIELSPWLLVCTLFLALFLALGKRRHELSLLEHRASLGEYSVAFLDQMITIVTAATVIAYAIYTIAPGTLSKFHSPALVLTIPFVVYGVFRYLFLLRERSLGGNPSRLLYGDKPLLVTVAGWLAVVVAVLYANRG